MFKFTSKFKIRTISHKKTAFNFPAGICTSIIQHSSMTAQQNAIQNSARVKYKKKILDFIKTILSGYV